MKRLCRNCPNCKSAKTGLISERYWCGLAGDGWNGKALGVYPWKNKPHPKCPLKEERKEALIEQAKQFREEILTVMETLGNHMCDVIERAEALREENEALIREADENAALAMQNKMRADDLAKENAALKERLEKAVEVKDENSREK